MTTRDEAAKRLLEALTAERADPAPYPQWNATFDATNDAARALQATLDAPDPVAATVAAEREALLDSFFSECEGRGLCRRDSDCGRAIEDAIRARAIPSAPVVETVAEVRERRCRCPACGLGVKADADGCCAHCGTVCDDVECEVTIRTHATPAATGTVECAFVIGLDSQPALVPVGSKAARADPTTITLSCPDCGAGVLMVPATGGMIQCPLCHLSAPDAIRARATPAAVACDYCGESSAIGRQHGPTGIVATVCARCRAPGQQVTPLDDAARATPVPAPDGKVTR